MVGEGFGYGRPVLRRRGAGQKGGLTTRYGTRATPNAVRSGSIHAFRQIVRCECWEDYTACGARCQCSSEANTPPILPRVPAGPYLPPVQVTGTRSHRPIGPKDERSPVTPLCRESDGDTGAWSHPC